MVRGMDSGESLLGSNPGSATYSCGLSPLCACFLICLFVCFLIFIYLATSGLSRNMQDLSLQRAGSLLQHMGFSLVVAPELSSCGTRA